METRQLDTLRPDEEGVVARVDAPGGLRHRLVEMGFVPGTTVAVAAAMLIVSLGVYFLVGRAARRDQVTALRTAAQRERKAPAAQGRLVAVSGTQAALLTPGGKVVLGRRSRKLPEPPRAASVKSRVARFGGDGRALLRKLPDGMWLALARRDPQSALVLTRLARYLWILSLIAVVVSAAVASEMRTMFEQVVNGGTGVAAAVPGYLIGGKTGTSQIPYDNGTPGYIPGAFDATFVGFAPANHPVLSVIVTLNRPTPIYGGAVAAPVFSKIMAYALHRYDVPTSPGLHGKPQSQAPSTITALVRQSA